jgi:UDP-N-acetylglucosamine:LPS N-acetylglucosamine transferase
LVVAGAAIMVPDAECTAARLEAEIAALLCDSDRLAAMGNAARMLGHPDAAAKVAELVDAHAR